MGKKFKAKKVAEPRVVKYVVTWTCCEDPAKEFFSEQAAKEFAVELLTEGDENCCNNALSPSKVHIYQIAKKLTVKYNVEFV